MAFMVRQGDVLLIGVTSLPSDVEVVQEGGEVVLALGETTGHRHLLLERGTNTLLRSPTADQFVNAAQQVLRAPQEQLRGQPTQTRGYLDIKEATKLVHDEHSAIDIEPGKYKIVIQREYVSAERPTATLQPSLSSRSSRRIEDEAWTWSGGSWRSVED